MWKRIASFEIVVGGGWGRGLCTGSGATYIKILLANDNR
jgi:hypothetical protein